MHPKLRLVVEYGPKQSVKFYPLELLEIVEDEAPIDDWDASESDVMESKDQQDSKFMIDQKCDSNDGRLVFDEKPHSGWTEENETDFKKWCNYTMFS